MSLVEIDGVILCYGVFIVLSGFDLCLEFGEVFGLFGYNGVGKIIIIKLVFGLLVFSEGCVWVFGYDVRSLEVCCQFGYLLENVIFYLQFSGVEILCYFVCFKGVVLVEVVCLLEQVGFGYVVRWCLKIYLKGMCQCFGLVQVLFGELCLLLFDELMVGFDLLVIVEFY